MSGDAGKPTSVRRDLLKVLTGWLAGLIGAVVSVPGLAMLVHPVRCDTTSPGQAAVPVAKLTDLEAGHPVRVDVQGELTDAFTRLPNVKLGSCFLVRSASSDRVQAFSTVCPRLGCAVDWDGEHKQFVCLRDGSSFGLDGRVLRGPAPRDLDELEVVQQAGEVKVTYRRFRTGTPTKEEV